MTSPPTSPPTSPLTRHPPEERGRVLDAYHPGVDGALSPATTASLGLRLSDS
ncbi:hypothetical protein PR003_g8986 [Phytophthora rubi]|uniref:Uncharacterized protein n=1 Tax=Phytophthora rubi TaxID=129364 RepID=A0A6A3K4I6_9STRA|nr:hypothetical protein PR001_g18263 [Phytophthora rubi]KAE9343446.1 hypothetical protein PR003_g8986 [Phytophthora rubi]